MANMHDKLGKLCASKYLKPVDFDGKLPAVVTIKDINEEQMPSLETKLVMTFKEQEKGIILKDGHFMALRDIFGEDVILSNTIGKKITLFETTTRYKGQSFKVLQFDPPPAPKKSVPKLEDEFRQKAAAIKSSNTDSFESDVVLTQ